MLQILARQARRHGVVVEQAEDEISAINMALGSWYAGGRAMVTTSGGGFALMGEGLSLAGVLESPLVIHLGQRPGPATGMATRTEQGDLELARYSGHGEFPRALLAPGTLEEAFSCSRHAFITADASQSPVFILTDQYLLDSFHDLPGLPLNPAAPESAIDKTPPDYGRYAFTESGVSPRGIPGLGQGIVRADSHEHDEEGFLTEDFDLRTAMMDKRLRKLALLAGGLALPPVLFGPTDFTRLIVGWGSTCATVREALEGEKPPGTAFLHCPQVYPVPDAVVRHLKQAERIIVVENNATGQFARLLAAETGHRAQKHWLKYNGLPFSVEEVVELLRQEVAS
jgi:2-oxoglutarate ferredoxin oxidoreductase subunit alpha